MWIVTIATIYLVHGTTFAGGNKLTSTNFPNMYPNNEDTQHTLKVPEGYNMLITFQEFQLETDEFCGFDYVGICDENNLCEKKLCGTSLPDPITVNTSTATVEFHSDGSLSMKGFSLTYEKIEPAATAFSISGGPSTREGNVFYGGRPICDDDWDNTDAGVFCRMMGYQNGNATQWSTYGKVVPDFSMDDVQCNGHESNLLDCNHTSQHNCGSSEGAGVICSGGSAFSISGGPSTREGNVFYGGRPICDDHWDNTDAGVFCRMMGYQNGNATDWSTYGKVLPEFSMDDVQCNGHETNLLDCNHTTQHNCGSSEGAGVICSGENESESVLTITENGQEVKQKNIFNAYTGILTMDVPGHTSFLNEDLPHSTMMYHAESNKVMTNSNSSCMLSDIPNNIYAAGMPEYFQQLKEGTLVWDNDNKETVYNVKMIQNIVAPEVRKSLMPDMDNLCNNQIIKKTKNMEINQAQYEKLVNGDIIFTEPTSRRRKRSSCYSRRSCTTNGANSCGNSGWINPVTRVGFSVHQVTSENICVECCIKGDHFCNCRAERPNICPCADITDKETLMDCGLRDEIYRIEALVVHAGRRRRSLASPGVQQSLTYNSQTNERSVKIHVPSHADNQEITVLMHAHSHGWWHDGVYGAGLKNNMMLKLGSKCHIKTLPKTMFPVDIATKIKFISNGNFIIKPDDEKKKYSILLEDNSLTSQETDSLNTEIQQICKNHKLIKYEELEISRDEFEKFRDGEIIDLKHEGQIDECNLQTKAMSIATGSLRWPNPGTGREITHHHLMQSVEQVSCCNGTFGHHSTYCNCQDIFDKESFERCSKYKVSTWEQTKSDDCWSDCGKKGGPCPSFCGSNGYCCRKGYDGCPPGAGEASPNIHTCVTEIGSSTMIVVITGAHEINLFKQFGRLQLKAQPGRLQLEALPEKANSFFPVKTKGGVGAWIDNDLYVCQGLILEEVQHGDGCFMKKSGSGPWTKPQTTILTDPLHLGGVSAKYKSGPTGQELGETWWIIGGDHRGNRTQEWNSVEGSNPWDPPVLPQRLNTPCMVAISDREVFLAAIPQDEAVATNKAWIFSRDYKENGGWKSVPSLKEERVGPACGFLPNDRSGWIVVAGGRGKSSTEILDVTNCLDKEWDCAWQYGPHLGIDSYGASLVTIGMEYLILLGDHTDILAINSKFQNWEVIGKTSQPRYDAVVLTKQMKRGN